MGTKEITRPHEIQIPHNTMNPFTNSTEYLTIKALMSTVVLFVQFYTKLCNKFLWVKYVKLIYDVT